MRPLRIETRSVRALRLLSNAVFLACLCCASEPTEVDGVRVIDGDPSCTDCRIELRDLAMLGDSGDPASIRDSQMNACVVSQLSSGEYVMGGSVGGGDLFVYRW